MSVKQQAYQDLVRLSTMFRGLLEVGEELQRAGSIDEVTNEAQGRLDQTKAKLAQAEKQFADRSKEIEAKQAEADKRLEATKQELAKAQEQVAARQAEAERNTEKACTAADAVIGAAQAHAAEILNEARANAEQKARVELTDLNAQIAAAQTKYDELQAQIPERQAALDHINQQLEALRGRLGT